MPASGLTRLTGVLLAACQVLAPFAVPISALAQANDIDIEPPVIELQMVEEGTLGESQVFTATVTDNQAVTEVNLHFRLAAEEAYVTRSMESIGTSNIYTASIDTRNFTTDVIQYYLEAHDSEGNRTIRGFVFDPLERRLIAPEAPTPVPTPVASAPAESESAGGLSTRRKILYGALGLLLVGAIAAAASDDSSDNGGGSSGIPLNVTVQPLQ